VGVLPGENGLYRSLSVIGGDPFRSGSRDYIRYFTAGCVLAWKEGGRGVRMEIVNKHLEKPEFEMKLILVNGWKMEKEADELGSGRFFDNKYIMIDN
jgi:hypothetical protein